MMRKLSWIILLLIFAISVTPFAVAKDLTLTIVYDNNPCNEELETRWGFSCLVEGLEETILFDVGGEGAVLLRNMKKLGIDIDTIDIVVLSHIHYDHIGGLSTLLEEKPGSCLNYFPFYTRCYKMLHSVTTVKGSLPQSPLDFISPTQQTESINMKIALIIIAIVAIGALVFGICIHRYSTPEKRAERITQSITKKLDLNETQKASLNTLKEEILSTRQAMKSNRETDVSILRELLSQPRFDQERANTVVDSHIQEISSRTPGVISAVADFWDSLDPEQQAMIKTKMEKFQSCRRRCGFAGGHHL